MIRIIDIAIKDWVQLIRDRKVFLFSLIMPIAFTLMFGYASGGFSTGVSDARLPIGVLDQDSSRTSKKLIELFGESEVVRLENISVDDPADLERLVAANKLAGAIVIPPDYGRVILNGKSSHLTLFADTNSSPGMTIQAEVISVASRLNSATQTATIMEQTLGDHVPFEYAFKQALDDWKNPPIAVTETTSSILSTEKQKSSNVSLSHMSRGMMLQMAIAALMTVAQIIVNERKTRALQRLLTTATNRTHILLGHYLATFVMIFLQFIILILFGWLALKVDYMREPGAVALVAASAAPEFKSEQPEIEQGFG